MKREDLFEAIGDTEDELLDENVAPDKLFSRSRITLAVSTAACAAFVIGGTALLLQAGRLPEDTLPDAVVMTAENFNSPTGKAVDGRTAGAETDILTGDLEIGTFSTTDALPDEDRIVSSSAGCDTTPQPSAVFTDAKEAPEMSEETDTLPPEADGTAVILSGTWMADTHTKDGTDRRYYCFDTAESGSFVQQTDGAWTDFFYALVQTEDGAQQAVFLLGEERSEVQIDRYAGDEMQFTWEDGREERLVYLGEETLEQLQFYTNEMLCSMALQYYEAANAGERVPSQVAAALTENGTVVIQLYDNLGDHNSNADWYTVDPLTGEGTDSHGNAILLAEP